MRWCSGLKGQYQGSLGPGGGNQTNQISAFSDAGNWAVEYGEWVQWKTDQSWKTSAGNIVWKLNKLKRKSHLIIV